MPEQDRSRLRIIVRNEKPKPVESTMDGRPSTNSLDRLRIAHDIALASARISDPRYQKLRFLPIRGLTIIR